MCLGEEDLKNPDVQMKGENEVGGRVLPMFRVLVSRISQNPSALVEPALTPWKESYDQPR